MHAQSSLKAQRQNKSKEQGTTGAPLPPNGKACIIGHPAGEVKQMDPTCIIETEKRGQAADDYLSH